MTFSRRTFLRLTAGAAMLPILPRTVRAQAYPTKPVRIVVGFAPGNAADLITRVIGQSLSERLGQPVVIENRPGAGGTLGTEAVVRSAPDGYTLVSCSSADAVNASIYDKLNYNFIRDIVPVAAIAGGPLVLVVNPSFPAKTVPEFIAYAKANPGKVSYASAGIGTVVHVAGELFNAMAGVNLVHVPYRGLAPAVTDLLGGQVQAIFSTMPPAIEQINAGKLRGLAVTSTARYDALPALPTISDALPGYEATITFGLGAPRNTPAEVIDRLNKETNAALANPAVKAKLAELGVVASPQSPTQFGKLLADETEKWGKVIKSAGIKPQ
ncbi:MAG: tripartite tricarboxylate transporter substrate binding protein [Hyphomicrobiales bacterium]|nr:tripartite tricarboxylate transporter substrate binding protein [Hyphomicrobiales bacterium]